MVRNLILSMMLVSTTPWANAARPITVEHLERILTTLHGKPDAAAVRKISELELAERLTTAKLAELEKALPGPQSRAALIALADTSAFLKLPESEQLSKPAPDAETQHAMLQLAANYVTQTLSKLPNFFATQKVLHYEDAPAVQRNGTYFPREPLQVVAAASAVVLYRDGKQVIEWGNGKLGKDTPPILGLITSGEFGPILETVLTDAAQGKIEWSNWEPGDSNDVAVFAYSVEKAKSHYDVKFCCLEGDVASVFEQFSGYHGEIALDPASGTILRITMQADLKPERPVATANLMVEYGTVDIGGRVYICPRRSVAEVQAYQQTAPKSPQEAPNELGLHSAGPTSSESGWLLTLLNDVSYKDYHLFRSESRILPANEATPEKQ
ncbi:MAG TPA: hypothetical protein VMU48_11000 [Terracidiphilus sp.]|nr:hypothetical protein [Terracidiphilus sp.]